MIKLGSHVGMSGKKMFLGSVEEALSYGANTFMIYTGAPQNTRRKAIEELNVEAGHALMKASGIHEFIVHAPYIINLGNSVKPETFQLAIEFLQKEIVRTDALGAGQIILHPGAHVGEGADVGIARIIEGLNEVVVPDQVAQISLETMAGKGTECGRNFEEIARIIDGIKFNEKISVCFDTCHLSDAGYNVREDFDGVLNEFDKVVGLNRLKSIHINDSKNDQGAAKDRHANIGHGTIGFEPLYKIVHHPQLVEVPKFLETPYVGNEPKVAPYKAEIEMLLSGNFDPNKIFE